MDRKNSSDDDSVQSENGSEHDDVLQSPFPADDASAVAASLEPPVRTEPTLKERLVERERQARVETERARLKRQFALERAQEGDGTFTTGIVREHESVAGTLGEEESSLAVATMEEEEEEANVNGANNTITGTEVAAANEPLGYAMERFLADRTEVEKDSEVAAGAAAAATQEANTTREAGVIMERFLANPVLLPEQDETEEALNESSRLVRVDEGQEAHSAASNSSEPDAAMEQPEELEVHHHHNQEPDLLVDDMQEILSPPTRDSDMLATAGSIRSHSPASSIHDEMIRSNLHASTPSILEVEAASSRGHVSFRSDASQDGSQLEEHPEIFRMASSQEQPSSAVVDEPRVFRLTEAEIQEMAAIEEASIGNAPPSEERDHDSFAGSVGDLVTDFATSDFVDHVGMTMSERTQTTALESLSVTENQSAEDETNTTTTPRIIAPSTQDSMDHMNTTSSHDDGSVVGSVTAMPPSVGGAPSRDDVPRSLIEDTRSGEDNGHEIGTTTDQQHAHMMNPLLPPPLDEIVNRTIRPGHVRRSSLGETPPPRDEATAESGLRRSSSLPLVVDEFDFDKYNAASPPVSPLRGGVGSYTDLPGDELLWSPGGTMFVSPVAQRTQAAASVSPGGVPPMPLATDRQAKNGPYTDYGSSGLMQPSLVEQEKPRRVLPHMSISEEEYNNNSGTESQPLLNVPDFVEQHPEGGHKVLSIRHGFDDMVDSVFSSVRSLSTHSVEEEINESDQYLASGILARAFPERFLALLVTLMVEIPTVMMISGGSDRLCMLIGRKRYQLMMAFLPLSSAISGNVGLQASTLTTRAISHLHVTKNDFWKWFGREVGAAAHLGFAMGIVIGSVAYVASEYDFAFGFTIFMAQQVSILTAGLTGTFAPLLFSFIFHRDSGKWGGPLETAVQDIVGSFAMVIMSYRILLILGTGEVDPSDMCGSY